MFFMFYLDNRYDLNSETADIIEEEVMEKR